MRSIGLVTGVFSLATLLWAAACADEEGNDGRGSGGTGSSSSSGGTGNSDSQSGRLPTGRACSSADQCFSDLCVDGECAPVQAVGAACTDNAQCSTGSCVSGVCTVASCTDDSDCPSGNCASGVCAGFIVGGGAQWIGGGSGYQPLVPGCGPETAEDCTGNCEAGGGTESVTVIRPVATLCFAGEGDLTPEDPSAVIEQVIEAQVDSTYVHLRVTFDPSYVDNTYGENASAGWFPDGTETTDDPEGPGGPGHGGPGKSGHTFNDLVGSDHTELLLTDATGATVMEFHVDLVSESDGSPCGYETLGVNGGDGKVITGSADSVLAVATSISRNLNGCGYCAEDACNGDCTVDSPATDAAYTPSADTPNWDYRQSYEVWIDLDAFGDAGFGQAYVTYTHASPSMAGNTLDVEPVPCPPDWGEFSGGGGTGGSGGLGGATGVGGGIEGCEPNWQYYQASEGAEICTPIPFSNWPGMAACPDGWVLDQASEGRYCLPAE
ncbi:MAG: hypothetical protein JW751_02005 [Polyangiaceae bacterium]|nr:hypothetical protein [Polyangiaceae bacterium]